MSDHPKDIGTTYRRQFSTPDDALRERENETRKAELQEIIDQGTQPHEGMAEFAERFDAALEHAGAVDVAQNGHDAVNNAIAAKVAQATARVEAALRTPEQRMASAFADELEARGVVLGDTHFHGDDDDDEFTEATPEERAEMEAYLQEPDEDPVIGTDGAGNVVYQDRETGEEYILTEAT
jgi:hypothetical protein